MLPFEKWNNSTIHDSHFTSVQGNVYNNYNGPTSTSSGTMDLIRRNKDAWPESADNFTRFKFGDLEFMKRLRCLEFEIQLKDDSPASERRDTNPFRPRIKHRSTTLKVIKVTRTVHTAKIAGRGPEMFTVVRYEVAGGSASHALAACKPEFEYWSQTRHPKLPQLFGVTHASIPVLVYHNARVNAVEVLDRYQVSPIVYTYLQILNVCSLYCLHATYSLLFKQMDYGDVISSVPGIFSELVPSSSWDFDFSTQSFYYNLDLPVNTHVKALVKITSEYSYVEGWGTLGHLRPQIPPPALDSGVESRLAMIDYVSRITGDYLDVIAMLGLMSDVDPLEIALDGLIPFGACFQKWRRKKRGPILASFQYTDIIPEWEWRTGLDVNVSTSLVNSYIRISFPNWQQGGDFIFMVFIAPSLNERRHVRRAFLSQSFVFMEKTGVDLDDTCYLLDSVTIDIKGQFQPLHSAASTDPIYLFIGPFKWQDFDRMPCLKCPLNGSFAHWSLNPDGPSASFNADEYGLPQLEQEFRVGTCWGSSQYKVVEEYLCFKEYNPYSTAYAENKGYPFLTYRNTVSSGNVKLYCSNQ